MRVLHVTSHLDVGGITSHVLSLSQALRARGWDVTVGSGGGQRESEAAACGLAHVRLPLHTSMEFGPGVWWAIGRLIRWLRRRPVELIHAHTRVAQVAAAISSRRMRVPYVTTWHGFYRLNPGRRLWPCTGQATIAISEPVRRHLIDCFRVPPERVRLIPHGIETGPYEQPIDASLPRGLRARLGLPERGPVVGTMARLVPSKGVGHLIQAFARLRAGMPRAHLLIVGDGEARRSLEQVARGLGVLDAVHFAGTLPDARVALSLMDVFVFLPADREGFGLALLEAMASARPIVAVRQGGGAVSVLEESQAAVLVEPCDVGALTAQLTRLLADDAARREAGARAHAIAKTRYSLERMVDQVEAVYRELMGTT